MLSEPEYELEYLIPSKLNKDMAGSVCVGRGLPNSDQTGGSDNPAVKEVRHRILVMF